MYGHITGGKIYSIIILGFTFDYVMVYSLQRGLYPYIGYENIFYVLSGLSTIWAILLVFFKEKEFIVKRQDDDLTYSKLNQSM